MMGGMADGPGPELERTRHRSALFAFVLSLVRDFGAAEKAVREAAAGGGEDFGARIPGGTALSPSAIEGVRRAARAESPADWTGAVRACLEAAGGQARSLLTMRYRDGMSPEEIARRTKSTASAALESLSRARASLARCVEGRLGAERR